MGTGFNSFAASPLGSFIRSPLGERNADAGRPETGLWVSTTTLPYRDTLAVYNDAEWTYGGWRSRGPNYGGSWACPGIANYINGIFTGEGPSEFPQSTGGNMYEGRGYMFGVPRYVDGQAGPYDGLVDLYIATPTRYKKLYTKDAGSGYLELTFNCQYDRYLDVMSIGDGMAYDGDSIISYAPSYNQARIWVDDTTAYYIDAATPGQLSMYSSGTESLIGYTPAPASTTNEGEILNIQRLNGKIYAISVALNPSPAGTYYYIYEYSGGWTYRSRIFSSNAYFRMWEGASAIYISDINGFNNGGGFASANGIGLFNGTTVAAMGSGLLNGASTGIYTYQVTEYGSKVYAFGDFTHTGATSLGNYAAIYSGGSWSALPLDWRSAYTVSMNTMPVKDNILYINNWFDNYPNYSIYKYDMDSDTYEQIYDGSLYPPETLHGGLIEPTAYVDLQALI